MISYLNSSKITKLEKPNVSLDFCIFIYDRKARIHGNINLVRNTIKMIIPRIYVEMSRYEK